MASTLSHGSHLRCASKTDLSPLHLESYNRATSYLESGEKHRFEVWEKVFLYLQMQLEL